MPKLIVMTSVSIDGFFAGPDDELDWHLVDAELHRHFNEELAGMAAFLDGRRTHELMAGYWPTADTDPASSPEEAEFARIWRDKPKLVYSRTLQDAGGWNTTIVREVVPEEVRRLRDASDGDLVVGGAVLAAAFRRHDLIDEHRLYVHPVVVGRGRPLFGPDDAGLRLRLAETRRFGNGVVLLRYERP